MRKAQHLMTLLPSPSKSITPGLYLLTAVCWIVDATAFLALGMVFVEIMTGNLMFLAFGIGQGNAVESINKYLVPLITFTLGAIGGGAILRGKWVRGHQRFGYLATAFLIGVAFVLTVLWQPEAGMVEASVVVGFLAFAMGLQNALVLSHAMPDVATNVMTLTLVRLLSNWSIAGGNNARWRYRAGSLTVFFLAAMTGAAALQISTAFALGLAVLVYAVALPWLLRGPQPANTSA